MARLDFTEVTAAAAFTAGSNTISAAADNEKGIRLYYGYQCYVSSSTARFAVYNGTSNLGPIIEIVHITAGPNSVDHIRDSAIECTQGIFVEWQAGTIDHLSVFWG